MDLWQILLVESILCWIPKDRYYPKYTFKPEVNIVITIILQQTFDGIQIEF